MQVIKYFSAYLFIALGYISITGTGIETYLLVLFSFVIIPGLELILPEDKSSNKVTKDLVYDLILYSLAPLYIGLFYLFLSTIGSEHNTINIVGKLTAMGLLCGIFGINMAHELGHRKSRFDRFLAQTLLLTTQYTHFYIEHNRGHHKRVGTPEDPATARKGESLYRFFIRTVIGSYLSAWKLEADRRTRLGQPVLGFGNAMVQYAFLQITILALVFFFFGYLVLLYYIAVSGTGILLLETINYIEHYGLTRKKISEAAYERVQDFHSWNSDHILGRCLLFELTRHSHHHANSLIKYPRLESRELASQLPTGYPGMMLLSTIPPLWFRVMNKRLPQTG